MNKHSREQSCDIRHKSSEKEKVNNGMSDKVEILANKIYKEFERMISFYGSDVVEYLMPLIVGVLENLEELYRIKQSYEIELELLKDDNFALNNQYEKEKICKKHAEERILHVEYAYEEDKKLLEEKLLTTESVVRLLEVKNRNSNDSVVRLEEKVQLLKMENQKLYDRYTDVLKSHAEQLNRIKADTYREISPTELVFQNKIEKFTTKSSNRDQRLKSLPNFDYMYNKPVLAECTNQNHFGTDRYYEYNSNQNLFTQDYISHGEETMADILSNDQVWSHDYNDSGNGTDLIATKNSSIGESNVGFYINSKDIGQKLNQEHSLEMNNGNDSDTDITDDEFGIGKEIEGLIRENQELVDTKNALNVVKDDLINRLDLMTSENDVLREDINHLCNREADMKAKLIHLDNELKISKEELLKLKEAELRNVQPDPLQSFDQKTFSRTEMAILLEEKNHYKERLIELQDAIVYKEMCRVKKQFPELSDIPKPIKPNNQGIWNFFRFNHLFKKEEGISEVVDEKSQNLLSRFKHESDRSQLYSWSVPRNLIESGLPKRIPIPIKIQTIFEPKDIVICATSGYERSQGVNGAEYLWCLVQSNIKNNKNYYLLQMSLTEKVPELTIKYSICLMFPTIPFTMTEVPALIFVIKDFHSLITEETNGSVTTVNQESNDQIPDEKDKMNKIYNTKIQWKNKAKHNIGTKTLWFGCEKNQVVVYILLDNNKVENRMATLTMESEIDYIRYNLGRVFVIEKTGSVAVFDLNKEMNKWELNICTVINMSEGLPISDSCCDVNRCHLWLGSSTNCFILDMSYLKVVHSLRVIEDCHLTDHCTSIESMVIVDNYSLMLISVSRIGLLLGYDLITFKFKVSLDLKPSFFDLIEPIHGIEKSTLSLFNLTLDPERIWMTTDCGMTLVITLDTVYSHLNNQMTKGDKSKCSLQTDKVYISSHAFAQCIKNVSLLTYTSSSLCLENSSMTKPLNDITAEIVKKPVDLESNKLSKTYFLMTEIGSNYVNLNNSLGNATQKSNHAIIWKI